MFPSVPMSFYLSQQFLFAVCMNVESVFKREAFLLEWALAFSLYFDTTAVYRRLTTLFILPYSDGHTNNRKKPELKSLALNESKWNYNLNSQSWTIFPLLSVGPHWWTFSFFNLLTPAVHVVLWPSVPNTSFFNSINKTLFHTSLHQMKCPDLHLDFT